MEAAQASPARSSIAPEDFEANLDYLVRRIKDHHVQNEVVRARAEARGAASIASSGSQVHSVATEVLPR